MNNTESWKEIYDNTNFGNRYAFSYLVTLFHRRIKPGLLDNKELKDLNVLDFACSYGANSRVFLDLGMNVYGIEISEKTIKACIDSGLGDSNHFECVNLLDDISIDDVFPNVHFDLIIASECMYYFTNAQQDYLLNKFYDNLNPGGMLYASYPTLDTFIYHEYKGVEKDKDGMISVSTSGSISNELRVNLPDSKDDLRAKYSRYSIVDILTSNLQILSSQDEIEYHILAKKE